jgi:GNAT superfamily N-acetyltransferase
MGISIRKITREDADFMKFALREGTPLLEEDIDASVEMMLGEALPAGDPVLIAEDDGKPVGVHLTIINRRGMAYERGIATGYCTYVLPESRRKGIATLLREECFKILKQLNVKTVMGSVVVGNEAGLRSLLNKGTQIVAYVVVHHI